MRHWCLRAIGAGMAEDIADKAIAAMRASHALVLDEGIALYAAELAHQHRLATADALIYATALREKAELITCDAHFEGLLGVNYQPKALA
jgi:predicted nucleic acid-binding protein